MTNFHCFFLQICGLKGGTAEGKGGGLSYLKGGAIFTAGGTGSNITW